MANIAFGSKYFIFSKFSSIPKTSKIEQDRTNLQKEFNDYEEFKISEDLTHFKELDKYLSTQNHKELLGTIQKTKASEEGKIKSFETQKKSKKIKHYFKFKDSQKLNNFKTISESTDLERYNKLKKLISSPEFSSNKNSALNTIEEAKRKSKEEKSDKPDQQKADAEKQLNEMVQQEKECKQFSKSRPIKFFFKFRDSQKFKNFQTFDKSNELSDYFALEKYLASEKHKEKLHAVNVQESEENKKIKEHQEFKNSKKYKWYLALKDSDKFDELKSWKIVFEDNFSKDSLETGKWMTRYYWGDKIMKEAYALEFDQAFPTDGKNIEVNKTLKILTKKEKVEGKKWKLPFGFIPQEFDYSTGLVSTANSFRLKYGKIEAKIKVNYAKPVNYNFWMASEHNLPHVDILKLQKKKSRVNVGLTYGDITDTKGPTKKTADFSGLDVSQDFFIYTLEWSKDKLIWKINDLVVNEQTQGVPQDEMYLVFSSGMTGKADGSGLPASMEVDWVRCYQEV